MILKRAPQDFFMYLVVIAWLYVVLMMSVAEATNTTGTLLGAVITFFLYGLGPVALVVYLMGAPGRGKAIRRQEARQREGAAANQPVNSTINAPVMTAPDASVAIVDPSTAHPVQQTEKDQRH
jgi:hypothetical protein